MKKWKFLSLILFTFGSQMSLADTAKGTITNLRSPSYETVTVYFKIDPMPQGVTQRFYVRSDQGSYAGCISSGSEGTFNRTYSMLLTAKASTQKITVDYCLDTNGYGLVNFIEME